MVAPEHPRIPSDVMPDIGIANLHYVEQAYAAWLENPASIPDAWRCRFEAEVDTSVLANGDVDSENIPLPQVVANGLDRALIQERVERLIRTYRLLGHLAAELDPLGIKRSGPQELEAEFHGFSAAHMEMAFPTRFLSDKPLKLKDIITRLRNTYCRTIGVQYMHIDDLAIRHWLEERMESTQNRLALFREKQIHILRKLTDAELFEQFMAKKFPGIKRFSLEGGETLIPLMDQIVEEAGNQGTEEIVIGMAHRGRLNVLVNIMEKKPREIFRLFMDVDPDQFTGRGDVKYHMGFSSDRQTSSGQSVHLSLCFNPSHLESVAPVVIGRVRAKQDRKNDRQRRNVLGLIVHGDAAFAAQGVVQELFNMSQLEGYTTGGTIHIIMNNQIGFTTLPEQGRSTTYCTEVARMLQIPVFHVNGENPEGVAQVVALAMDFRQRFQRNVVIDMWCYRRHGHNEGDEPSFTQPKMYELIRAKPSVREAYRAELDRVDPTDIQEQRIEGRLKEEFERSKTLEFVVDADAGMGIWQGYRNGKDVETPDVETALPSAQIPTLMTAATRLPDGFTAHRTIRRILDQRLQMGRGERPFDWGGAEQLAFASLLAEGHPIRMTGQDSERGTFSHRHAVIHDQKSGERYVPLDHITDQQARFHIHNSPLSETGVLGFEFGYSLDMPDGLCLWEAQFGDFANVGQVMIDQFISSCQDKWFRLSALTLLLPHGYEGQGPDHSSARLERFLSLSAEDNIQVVNLTTPAQFFHCLRRQVLRLWRKPLVVMSPKSLLRHPNAVSSIEDFTTGQFQRILGDDSGEDPARIKKILMCSGKLYYELVAARNEHQIKDVAIIRLEQLYPLSKAELSTILAPYRSDCPVMWVQEEPWNMGAWHYLHARFGYLICETHPFSGVTRPESASPATGSTTSHKIEQSKLIEEAFDLDD